MATDTAVALVRAYLRRAPGALAAGLTLLGTGLLAAPATAQEGGLTVERIFTPPGADGTLLRDVTWRPGGEEVSFLWPARTDSVTGEEVLELWIADAATGERRRLATAEDLLGEERQTFGAEEAALRERLRLSARGITDHRWSPDGSRVLIPLSGDLFVLNAESGAARRLTGTDAAEFDPRWSPDGTRIGFVRGGELWVLDPATGDERRITPGDAGETLTYATAEFIAQEELGRRRGWWWSPDGRRIAYTRVDESAVPVFALTDYLDPYGGLTRQRYPRPGDPNATVELFVVGSDGGQPARMDVPAGPDRYLARVAWRPAGDLAVQVMPRSQNELRLLVVDPETGAARALLVEEDPEWVDLHDDLTWLADGGFLWTSARSGHRHVYRYGPDGSLRHAVTAGDWPVEGVSAVAEEAGWVWFAGHADGPFERHLYRTRLDGSTAGAPERVSVEPGWHEASFSPDRRRWLDTWARATKPPSVSVDDAATGERIAWIEENAGGLVAEVGLVEPEFRWVRPVAADGTVREDSLPAALWRPRDFDPSKTYPVLVYTYGGPRAQVAKDDWLTRGRGLWHQLMLEEGFLVWSCDGRGSGARGKAWVETVHRRLGNPETEDQAACARALWRLVPQADRMRTAIWGWSFGGFMAAQALAREPDTWAAAAAVAPVSDWRDYDTAYTERYMETPAENPEGYEATAPVLRAADFEDPFFLAWGTGDDNVHPVHSERLLDALVAAGHPVVLQVFPGRGHAIGDPPARIALFRALTLFLLRTTGELAMP